MAGTLAVGEGAILTIGSAITQLLSCSISEDERDTVETIHCGSTEKTFRVVSIRGGGSVDVEMLYGGDITTLTALQDSTTASSCTLALKDETGTSIGGAAFDAFLTGLSVDGVGFGENVKLKATLKISGTITWSGAGS